MSEGRFVVIRQGEHLRKIAAQHGLDPDRIWSHPDNDGLRKKRKNGDVLLPGDTLFVPDLTSDDEREEECPTEQVHTFVLTVPTIEIKVHLRLPDGTTLAGEPYKLTVARPLPAGDLEIEGDADGDGVVTARLPVESREARLLLKKRKITLPLAIGDLDPHRCEETKEPVLTGVQARLNNLGFACGRADGVLGPRTRKAIADFQRVVLRRDEPSGELDDETCARLAEEHLS